ncbi:MAG: hypothetical protein INH34_11935 [Phycisphaerales bacterium]|nr:hypothetical protein [Phycisphaerales bacterium]
MAHQAHNFPIVTELRLKDAGAVNSSAAGTVGGQAAVVDLQQQAPGFAGNAPAASYARFAVVVDWSACEVDSSNELYRLEIQGSDSPTFASGVYTLAERRFGHSSVAGSATSTPPSGRLALYADNVACTSATDGSAVRALRYVRCFLTVTGTAASGFNFSASIAPE